MLIEDGTMKIADNSDIHNGKLIIPDEVVVIGQGVFIRCRALRHLIISNSVKIIDSYAFYACKSLEDVSMSDSVQEIYCASFAFCEKLKSIKLPHNLLKIDSNIFTRYKSGLIVYYDETQLHLIDTLKTGYKDIAEFVLKPYNCDIF